MSGTRAEAATAVELIAAKLSDVDEVFRLQENELAAQRVSTEMTWVPMSLEGAAGIALLFAELAPERPECRAIAHRYLGRLTADAARAETAGLNLGLGSLAFALAGAARSADDYAQALGVLDRRITGAAVARARAERDRIRDGSGPASFLGYDVPSGLSGTGRYLLRRGDPAAEALAEVLTALVALSRPRPDGLPGWWVEHEPFRGAPGHTHVGGHANFGLAHGAAGPLALLALAWRDGVRVDGHREAIERIADWYADRAEPDEHGVHWPATVSREPYLARRPQPFTRAGWCYGTPGIARAVQLAALALDRADWHRLVADAVLGWLRRPDGTTAVPDAGLCHGWAGLGYLTGLLGRDLPDDGTGAEVVAAAEPLVRRALDRIDPDAPFGIRFPLPAIGVTADFAGFLQGATGVALALHAHATGTGPVTGWDTALLVA